MNAAMAREGSPSVIYRKDYQAPRFHVPTVAMTIAIFPGYTRVTSQLQLQRSDGSVDDLCLDGESLQLEAIAIDGVDLSPDTYDYNGSQLTLKQVLRSALCRPRSLFTPKTIRRSRDSISRAPCIAPSAKPRAFARLPFSPTVRTSSACSR